MWTFIFRRLLYMIPLLLVVSFVGFFITWVEPGDVLTGCEFTASKAVCDSLRVQLGLDQPFIVQYYIWIRNIVCCTDVMDNKDPSHPAPWKVWSVDSTPPFVHYRPYFGDSQLQRQPVVDVLFGVGGKSLVFSLVIVGLTTLFVWMIAVPIGIFSATRKYSVADHTFTFMGFMGLSFPDFFLALLSLAFLLAIQVGTWCGPVVDFFRAGAGGTVDPSTGLLDPTTCQGLSVGGLFSNEFILAPWSWAKARNFIWHLLPLVIIVGAVNLASIMRYMRSNLLDVLALPYVKTARAKGLSERKVIYKHAARNAINPLITMLGYWIPTMFESLMVAAAVLNVDVVEKNYWAAINTQDQPVVMAGILFFAVVLLVGNLIADILLVFSDPRIRYE